MTSKVGPGNVAFMAVHWDLYTAVLQCDLSNYGTLYQAKCLPQGNIPYNALLNKAVT